MKLQNKRNAQPIDKVLSWAHNLQTTCFGTPVDVTISTFTPPYGKGFSIEVHAGGDVSRYVFDSTMQNDLLMQTWGGCKDYANRQLDALVGHKINARGHVTE